MNPFLVFGQPTAKYPAISLCRLRSKDMTQREEFEKFWMKHCKESHLYCNLFRNNLGAYIDTYAEYAFKGWKESKEQAVPQWIPVSERLPVCFKSVFAIQETVNGSRIIVIAKFIGKYMEESDGQDDSFSDYKEANDTYYLPEGWYEQQVNWDEYSGIYISDKITHWMPLPELPIPTKDGA